MKALPSYWKGTTFRSRTEARWAVFFLLLDGAPHSLAFQLCAPEGLEGDRVACWIDVGFSDRYTIDRHDGAPRMYFQPAPYELGVNVQPRVSAAMEVARGMELRDPAEHELRPTGWEGVPIVTDDIPW